MENFYIHNAIRSLYPNVVTIRGEESFDEAITDISATKIRKELGLK